MDTRDKLKKELYEAKVKVIGNFYEPVLIIENVDEKLTLYIDKFNEINSTQFRLKDKEINYIHETTNLTKELILLETLLRKYNYKVKITESSNPLEQKYNVLFESDLEKAQLVLAGMDLLNELQQISEQLAKIQTKTLLPLLDKIKLNYGNEYSLGFASVSKETIHAIATSLENARDKISTELKKMKMYVNNEEPETDMNSIMSDGPSEQSSNEEPETTEEPTFDNPMGRTMKEGLSEAKQLSYTVEIDGETHKITLSKTKNEHDEYVVKYYINNKFNDNKSYYDTDYKSALDTFNDMKKRLESKKKS